ncbi:hypothetical protein CY34DRAFT_814045 [Suillus luteus UH-Slu-Lm8-n1]|uniref:Uncharacterized protein n=1 Tax=Suillus luteus UH-Slu-Lm8-n1 TaxID=930992 RepID=A0A0C9Z5V2_9AGAM|nr:hypothetical protein CY34DRAFT_814045 [Suillus luteus UH-Slu-Lm8-n1]
MSNEMVATTASQKVFTGISHTSRYISLSQHSKNVSATVTQSKSSSLSPLSSITHRQLWIFSAPSSQYENGLHVPSRIVGASGPQIIDVSFFEPEIEPGNKELVW